LILPTPLFFTFSDDDRKSFNAIGLGIRLGKWLMSSGCITGQPQRG